MQAKLILVLALVALAHAGEFEELQGLWASWKLQNNKVYATQEEDDIRFAIFSENVGIINTWNANPQDTFTMAINQFADLTGEEFKSIYASCNGGISEVGNSTDPYCPSAVDCPTLNNTVVNQTVNWTDLGAVTPIKNQGQCGSCWTFSTTGVLEGLNYLQTGELLSFSEQQIVDCCTTADGCDGGFPYLALQYTATNGIELESEYPYTAADGKCKYNSDDAHHVNTGYQCIAQKSSQQLIAAGMLEPVSIAVEANQLSWQFYGGGVVNLLCGAALDHAVLLVGWGQKNGQNAYYVKNSWGETWGDAGYIWIGQNDNANDGYGVCGILRCATLPLPVA